MADKYAQGGVTAEGTPTPTSICAGEYVVKRDFEIRAKGHGLGRLTGHRIATVPVLITCNGSDGKYSTAGLMRDIAAALMDAADALDADAINLD